MSKVAFLGLGMMGSRMATRLLEAGHELTVWNRTSARAAPLVSLGAAAASRPAEAAAGAEFVITMLAAPDALEEVVFGEAGLVQGLRPGQLLIDVSTVGPDADSSVAGRLPEGVSLVDAPVRGVVSGGDAQRPHPSAWSPFRHRVYRDLWIAQFVSNVGTWMQTVGAVWVMLELNGSPDLRRSGGDGQLAAHRVPRSRGRGPGRSARPSPALAGDPDPHAGGRRSAGWAGCLRRPDPYVAPGVDVRPGSRCSPERPRLAGDPATPRPSWRWPSHARRRLPWRSWWSPAAPGCSACRP